MGWEGFSGHINGLIAAASGALVCWRPSPLQNKCKGDAYVVLSLSRHYITVATSRVSGRKDTKASRLVSRTPIRYAAFFKAWYWPCVLMFKCLGWHCPATFIFRLRDTNRDALVSLRPETRETAVHCCDPTLSVLVMLVSRNFFHVVSALQSFVYLNTFLADQIFHRSYVSSVYRVRSLSVSGFIYKINYSVWLRRRELMSRIERKHCLISISYTWQGYLTFSYYFIFYSTVRVLVSFYQWRHFVMLIIIILNLICVQSEK